MMFGLLERVIGRDLLWRLSRRAYHHVRREGSLDAERNGESWLQDRFARRSAEQKRPLTIIDVGGNYGQWSSLMLSALGRHNAPKARLTIFEPVPAIRAKLAEKLGASTAAEITIEPLALSEFEGTLPMVVNAISAGTHHLGSLEENESGTSISVEVTTLDRYWEGRAGTRIDFVKIDAEGYDADVVMGMRGLLSQGAVEVVQIEYGALFMRTRKYLRDLIALANANGYRFGSLYHGGIELFDDWHPDMESHIAAAKVFVCADAAEWLGATRVRYTASNTITRQ